MLMKPRATRQHKRPLSLFSSRVAYPLRRLQRVGLLFLFSAGWPTLYAFRKGWVPSSPHLCDAGASVHPQNRRVPAWSTPNNSSPISFSAPSHAPVISTGLNDSSRSSLPEWPSLLPKATRHPQCRCDWGARKDCSFEQLGLRKRESGYLGH